MQKKKFNPALGELFSDSKPAQPLQKSAKAAPATGSAVPSWAIPASREHRTQRLQLLFPPSLVTRLKTLADAHGISLNHLIISLLEAHLDAHTAD